MAEPDENDLNAAERALGTEPREGETPDQRRARQPWDRLLAPLALAAPPADPPPDMFDRITRELEKDGAATAGPETTGAPDTARMLRLAEHRARRWRVTALALGGLAACLLLAVAGLITLSNLPVAPPASPQRYIALVTPEGGSGPAMIVEIDIGTGMASVRSLRVEAPVGRALELWRIPPGGTPLSLGLVDPQRDWNMDISAEPGDILAITVEPPGGAPGGVPSGAPILSGPLVAE